MDIPSTTQYKDRVFFGEVVNNNDPLKLDRIQASISTLFGNTPTEFLPWIGPRTDRPLGVGGGSDSCYVPVVGSYVFVAFEGGNPHFPYYWSAPVTSGIRNALFLTNYPNRYGYIDPKGNYYYTDMTNGEIKLYHHTGTYVEIDPQGNVIINGVKDGDITLAGNANITVTGNTTVTTTGNTAINTTGNTSIHTQGTTNLTSTGNMTSSAPSWTHTGTVIFQNAVTVQGLFTYSAGMVGSGGSGASAQITGSINVTNDVTANGISLFSHRHTGVQTGTGDTGTPI